VQENASSSEELASTAEELSGQTVVMRESIRFMRVGNGKRRRSPRSERRSEENPSHGVFHDGKPENPKAAIEGRVSEDDDFDRF
jgi:methyl-accepting chemotaxis protein